MSQQVVKVTQEGPVLVVRLSSPENRNSLTMELRQQLGEAVELAEGDPSVRAVFLTAEGPTFCSGGDFKMLQTAVRPVARAPALPQPEPLAGAADHAGQAGRRGRAGQAVGGGMGLALTGDVVIAGESAKFMSGFFRLGVVPDVGMMYHLPRLIGMARAKNFSFQRGTMTAQEALELGLVAKVVPDDQVETAGLAEAARLAEGPAEVMGLAKTLMARSFETSLHGHVRFRRIRAGAGHVQSGIPRRPGRRDRRSARRISPAPRRPRPTTNARLKRQTVRTECPGATQVDVCRQCSRNCPRRSKRYATWSTASCRPRSCRSWTATRSAASSRGNWCARPARRVCTAPCSPSRWAAATWATWPRR